MSNYGPSASLRAGIRWREVWGTPCDGFAIGVGHPPSRLRVVWATRHQKLARMAFDLVGL